MSTFSIFPPTSYELFEVYGTDELEDVKFATCTSEDFAHHAQELFLNAGIPTRLVIDKTGLNAVIINEERIDLTQDVQKLTM